MRKLVVLRDANLIALELRDRALRSASLSQGNVLSLSSPEAAPQTSPILEQVTKAKDRAESEAIGRALNATHWNRKQAALLLKIDYKALLYKMKKLGLEETMVSLSAQPESEAAHEA